MELVTGKRPVEPEFGENKDIVFWVCSNAKDNDHLADLVDSAIPECQKEDALKLLRIGVLCTNTNPGLRPSMRLIVQMLEEAEPCSLTTIVVSKDGERISGLKYSNSR